eukprot:16647-Eustigmatos_ZCMA.PRE.1
MSQSLIASIDIVKSLGHGCKPVDLARMSAHGTHTIAPHLLQSEELVFCQICREYQLNSNTYKLTGCGH